MPDLTIQTVLAQPPAAPGGDAAAAAALLPIGAEGAPPQAFGDLLAGQMQNLLLAHNGDPAAPDILSHGDDDQDGEAAPPGVALGMSALAAFVPAMAQLSAPLADKAVFAGTGGAEAASLKSSAAAAGGAQAAAPQAGARAAEFAAPGNGLPLAGAQAAALAVPQDGLAVPRARAFEDESQPVAPQHAEQPQQLPNLAPAAEKPAVTVAQPVGRPGWSDAFSQKVVWVANQQVQAADIQLNPPELGPIEVRLSLQHGEASLAFISPHAAVRDAIQSALPRLGEMFADGGLNLGNVFVGSESAAQQQGFERRGREGLPLPDFAESGSLRGGVARLASAHDGMVDIFA